MAESEVDIYDDVEPESGHDLAEFNDADLYDDVITARSHDEPVNEEAPKPTGTTSSQPKFRGKRVSIYISNLTWWTTDQDLTEAITDLGVTDLIDIKFYENRINGQSKGFATVVLGSDASMRILYEKMQKKEIHGQNPVVMPYTKQSLAQLDGSNSGDGLRNDMASLKCNTCKATEHDTLLTVRAKTV